MKRTRMIGATVLFLIAGSSAVAHAQGRGQEKQAERRQRRDDRDKKSDEQVSTQEQQRRTQQEQQRAAEYKQRLDEQVRVAQQQAAELQTQRRVAQARAQQQYAAELREQQQRLAAQHDYSRDPYVNAPQNYRYVIDGNTHQTNQYGADVLRRAVNTGYQQGFGAGEADREDRRRSSYRNSFGYRDANFGYGGNYVDQSDYNYYFREGFRRGYADGFSSRSQYGTSSNGTPTILSTLLTTILGLQSNR
jgi:Membrane protein involved in colicin uptake